MNELLMHHFIQSFWSYTGLHIREQEKEDLSKTDFI